MHREVIWAADDGIGSEYLILTDDETGYVADSVIFASRGGEPARVHYVVRCDRDWRMRGVTVSVARPGQDPDVLQLRSDGAGHWTDADGKPLPEFDGCIDIDISATPFTNTLPIRRLNLRPGQVEPIRVLFIHVPTLKIEPWDQRYTGLEPDRVRYESIGSDFVRELEIDEDGLVTNYPGLFRRVWSR
jgi:hypothetical protein